MMHSDIAKKPDNGAKVAEAIVELTPKLSSANAAKKYCASGAPTEAMPDELAAALLELRARLHMPLWLLIQRSGDDAADTLAGHVVSEAHKIAAHIPPNTPFAVVLETDGGYAKCAYQISRLFHIHSGGFAVVVPSRAKSAGTLLCCGAREIYMSRVAELGPIDVQLVDYEREDAGSALDEVHALKQLQYVASEAIDVAMSVILTRSGKKINSVLPDVLQFAANFARPLLEKIEVVHYTKSARDLKVGEQYATNLLKPFHTITHAVQIANRLTEGYPDHDFMIDMLEAKELGLPIKEWDADTETVLTRVGEQLSGCWIGLFQEQG